MSAVVIRSEALHRVHTDTLLVRNSPNIAVEDKVIPGPRGDLPITIIRPLTTQSSGRPGILFIHGGAVIRCNRYSGLDSSIEWARQFDAITVSVEYGLAPENPGKGPVTDCFAALRWFAENAESLGVDPGRLMIYGISAGGGLAAATALMSRDQDGPALRALFLECPMLDDRNQTVSCQQFATGPMYNSTFNKFAWSCLLGDRAGSDDVSYYEAPGRAEDLAGLPPTFVDVASADPFRDEVVGFASKLWKGGVAAELHVWPGGPHGYDRIVPNAAISVLARRARWAWIARTL
ncbi:Alpha/Beta hydrolase protein [Microdochium trichocladiopsis]|uniref:Alpha/Beta hydrolase protein n=1 Tax=Microdochium trichocladiopsis TaxID=1682393 RepID=A0A9P8Y7N7_9PEZI|nr:Alpha/Beta hydrolase protein [Microdochium trichocladiopsis]KAH7031660.1 Alpha/Beta hydrolase protein [Microdochium trichocladiopsis]